MSFKNLSFLFLLVLSVPLYGDITGIITPPAGNNEEVQFNKRQAFGADSDFKFSTTTNRLSVPSILVSSIVFTSDGSTQTIAGGGSGTPGGSNTQVQYNNSGSFGGSSNFTFNGTTASVTGVAASTITSLLIGSPSGTLKFRGGFGSETDYDTIVGGEHYGDFFYLPGSNKVYLRSLMVNEINDTSEIAIRRFNGSTSAPTEVLPDEFVGLIYWQPYGADGTFNPPYASPRYGRIAQISAQTYGTQTADSRAGKMIFATTPLNDNVGRQRFWITPEGYGFFAGGGNYEWTVTGSTEDESRDGTINAQNYHGNATLTVIAPTDTVNQSAIMIVGMRGGTNPTISNGFAIDYSSNTDIFSLVAVSSSSTSFSISTGTKSTVFSVPRTTRKATFSDTLTASKGVNMATATISSLNCTGFSNSGKLTTDSSGNISCADDASGGGGASGQVNTSAQNNVGYYSVAGTSNVISGNSSFTWNGTTVATIGLSASTAALRQIVWADGTVQVSSPTGGGGTPGGSNTEVQYNNAGSFAGSSNFTFDGSSLTVPAMTLGRGSGVFPPVSMNFSGAVGGLWMDNFGVLGLSNRSTDATRTVHVYLDTSTVDVFIDGTDGSGNKARLNMSNNGSASRPAITFNQDSSRNTGLYLNTSDSLGFAANGSQQMLLSTAGINVTYGVVAGSGTFNDLTASRPVLSDANKKLTSGQIDLSNTNHITGTLAAAQFPALTGDITTSAGNLATTAAALQANIKTFSSSITVTNASGVNVTYGVIAGSVTVADDAYAASWNGSTEVPTKNAVYDKIETISVGSGGGIVSPGTFTWTNPFGVNVSTVVVGSATATSNGIFDVWGGTVNVQDNTIAHGLTSVGPTNAYMSLRKLAAMGGTEIIGLSSGSAQALALRGVIGATDPTDTVAAVSIIGAKNNGSGSNTNLDNAETVMNIRNAGTVLATMLGDGKFGIGTVTPSFLLDVNGVARSTNAIITGLTASQIVVTDTNKQLASQSVLYATRTFVFDAVSLHALETNFAPIESTSTLTVIYLTRAFDDTTREYANGFFTVPDNLYTGGTITITLNGRAKTAASANTAWTLEHLPLADSEGMGGSYLTSNSGDLASDTTQADLNQDSWTMSVSSSTWSANDAVFFRLSRNPSASSDLTGDYYLKSLTISIPVTVKP